MSDLISREAVKAIYCGKRWRYLRNRINKLPAIDAVEVVRCEDCDVPHNKWTGCPMLNGLVTPPDFYCGFGERREEADGKTICGTGSL